MKMNNALWALLIGGVSLAGALTLVYEWSRPLVDINSTEKGRALIQKMVPKDQTDLVLKPFTLLAPNYLHMGDIQNGIRIVKGDETIEVIYTALSHEGYHHDIAVLAGFDKSCTVKHVEIISEKETPGLGDQYKKNNNAWLHSLEGKTPETQWNIKPAGDIDSWTGATVTPRAIAHTLDRMQQLCVNENGSLFNNGRILYLENSKPK